MPPPKRKISNREQESKASSSRATRSSTHLIVDIAADNQLLQTSNCSESISATSQVSDKRRAASKGSGLKKTKQNVQTETETPEPPLKKVKRGSSNKANAKESVHVEGAQAVSKGKSTTSLVKYQAYMRSRMEKLFVTYADIEDPSYIGADGLERLCTDANIPMDGPQPLILAWFLEASELGKFTKEEWLRGCDILKIDTLEKLALALSEYENQLIYNKIVPSKGATWNPYNRHAMFDKHVKDISATFDNFYKFVFVLAKTSQERNIDAEMAKAFWLALLPQQYPMVKDFVHYIDKHTTLKGVNKDLWVMVLEFFKSGSSLEGHEVDNAWPTIIDNFVAWRKSNLSGAE